LRTTSCARLAHEAVEDRGCHLFTVLGVAGVGKSRLVDEFVAGVGDAAAVATGRCLAYGSGITYWPVAEALRSGIVSAEVADADQPELGLAALLRGEPDAERLGAAVGSLLGMSAGTHDQEELFWAVREAFEAMARRRPLVLVLDDIHWGEPTFLDLVEHIADWTRDAPILLIAMARLELLEARPLWGNGRRRATTVRLEALSESLDHRVAQALAPGPIDDATYAEAYRMAGIFNFDIPAMHSNGKYEAKQTS